MRGVCKVAEEIREHCCGDEKYVESGSDVHRMSRAAVLSNTNGSFYSQEGDNPLLPKITMMRLQLRQLVELMLTRESSNNNCY